MASVTLEQICKTYDKASVLQNISFTVQEGEFVSLLGPSGCGKTTLLKLIAGLEPPDSGHIYLSERCCDNIPTRERGAVIVFQDFGLFPHMTVQQNIEFGLHARGESRPLRARKATDILRLVQLEEKAQNYPHELSGGQKQRVALARACVLEPAVLLLDEPFSSLDTALKDAMREQVELLHKRLKMTTILVTHDKEEAFMLSDKVAVMLEGGVQQMAPPHEIFSHPATMQVAQFIGDVNLIDGHYDAAQAAFSCMLGDFKATANYAQNLQSGAAQMLLRYTDLALTAQPCANAHPCTVQSQKYRGGNSTYKVQTQSGAQLILSSSAQFAKGEVAYVQILNQQPHILNV